MVLFKLNGAPGNLKAYAMVDLLLTQQTVAEGITSS
jgi:hypothetical protein